MPIRMALLMGMLTKDNKKMENIPEYDRSMYSQEKYKFFLDAPFNISSKCCSVMKKQPVHSYAKQTGRKPMTAQMADESRLRTQQWIKNGCNGFDMKSPISNPMSFWTEQDVLLYIKMNNIEIASVFLDNKYNLSDVNHIDGNKNNNSVDNLEWCSHRGNQIHMYENRMTKKAYPVLCIETNKSYNSMSEAERDTGISHKVIKKLCETGREYNGYHWRLLYE